MEPLNCDSIRRLLMFLNNNVSYPGCPAASSMASCGWYLLLTAVPILGWTTLIKNWINLFTIFCWETCFCRRETTSRQSASFSFFIVSSFVSMSSCLSFNWLTSLNTSFTFSWRIDGTKVAAAVCLLATWKWRTRSLISNRRLH